MNGNDEKKKRIKYNFAVKLNFVEYGRIYSNGNIYSDIVPYDTITMILLNIFTLGLYSRNK